MPDWTVWPELGIRLDHLPLNVTPAQVWKWFSPEGEITYIDLFQDHDNQESMSGKVKFEPPPKRAFWKTGQYIVPHPDGLAYPAGLSISISVWKAAPNCSIRSPICPGRQYPIKTTLHLLGIQFGMLIGHKRMEILKSLPVRDDDKIFKAEFNLKLKQIIVFFPWNVETHSGKQIRRYKIIIEFSTIKDAHITRPSSKGQPLGLILTLKFPARYYWERQDINSTFTEEDKSWDSSEAWYRATDIVKDVGTPMLHPIALHAEYDDPEFINIGRWTTIRLLIGARYQSGDTKIHENLISSLEDFGVANCCENFRLLHGRRFSLWNILNHTKVHGEEANALHLLTLPATLPAQIPFEVRYQLEVCISCGLLNEQTITPEFLQELARAEPTKARLLLEFVADQNEKVYDPMTLLRDPDAWSYFPDVRIPYYCALVRKAIITPTTVRFSTPTVEMSHRVLRRYNNIHDRFLRIQFTEEGEEGRIKVNKEQNDEIWKRLLRTLYQGIKIGDRLYEFLAFGSSQLRQSGAFFFCPTSHISCDDIRKWMGNFDHIRVIAKYSARLGQCLSTTREIRGISVPMIRPIPDIERNGHCFTDGVGKISQFLAQMIIQDIHLDVFENPCAFQFRMGGCKGVLAVWEDAKKTEVHVRQSQEKFKSEFNGLEIIRCAKFATATLNRQTITILEGLGVPYSAFLGLLNAQLHDYEFAMDDNLAAVGLLRRFVDENQTTLAIAELLEAGFKTGSTQEPFVVNILGLWRSWSLKLLKEKARIHVERSAFVLGCVDETGSLRGHSRETEASTKDKDASKLPQIFIQITTHKDYARTTVIKGICLVGRNPSLHPGDIRVVEAVDEPKLHHLRDVVVFPSTGDRPVPNMLSGGDLDGDDFFVIWEDSLIPRIWNWPPMDYTASKPKYLDRDVNVDDLRNFFVKYMKNDALPLIATSHLAMADKYGPESHICLRLADLHSQAVDYAKTGEPAIMKKNLQPRRWPHFMEKKSSYHSVKALGKIYDRVVDHTIQFTPIWDSPFDERITCHKTFKPDADLLRAARQIKVRYDTSVRRLLSQHNLQTEFELWTGFSLSKPNVGSDYKRQEDLGREYDALKQQFREICYEAAGGKHPEAVNRFVAAMYIVTEEEVKAVYGTGSRERPGDEDRGLQSPQIEPVLKVCPMISFPWIFHWVLIRLATDKEKSMSLSGVPSIPQGRKSLIPLSDEQVQVRNPHQDATKVGRDQFGTKDDIEAQLIDGTIIQEGEPLILFDDPVLDSPSLFCADKNEEPMSSKGDNQQYINGDTTSVTAGVEEKRTSHKIEIPESAMDRLASLIGCVEDEQAKTGGVYKGQGLNQCKLMTAQQDTQGGWRRD
ncbi:RNA dependent RNA polymerase-domain-containing protein [Mariannaea sp. PMI_226]|nr:RNA dependent RNA polymerase-domain-containing protein [Mariannaea sp. PMI_226]